MKRYLILADGSIYEGESAGASGEVIGEVVFNTSMVGYMETLSDPRYYGQLVAQTFPIIGNYGAIECDCVANPQLSGYIVREICSEGSNFRKDGELNEYLIKNNIVAISGIDVRSLTRKLRDNGVINGMITSDNKNIETKLKQIKAFKIINAVKSCTNKQAETSGNGLKVALMDFGAPVTITQELIKRGCQVTRFPAFTSVEEILNSNPDGVLLSSGGGNPEENEQIIENIAKLSAKNIPMFGIGLGHQLLALALGGYVTKLKYGHRGSSQPVKNLKSGVVHITSQNHGYVVNSKKLPQNSEISYINVNDKTIEGLDYKSLSAFSVQFMPDTHGGPNGTEILYDRFVELMRGEN